MNPASSLVRVASAVSNFETPVFRIGDLDPSVQIHVKHTAHGSNIALAGWGQLLLKTARFGVGSSLEALSAVHSLQEQIDVVELSMETTTLDPDMYATALNSYRDALSLAKLYSPWGETRALFTPHLIALLKVCEQALGEQESKLESESIAEVLEDLFALEEHAMNQNLSPEVRLFLIEVVSVTRRALAEYTVIGVRAIFRARQLIIASMQCADGEVANKLDDESKTKTVSLIQRLSGLAEKAKPFAEFASKLLALANPS